ncbi:MAG: chromosomal replication initiator protein DnaA, partial [Planctomycetota bacterium]
METIEVRKGENLSTEPTKSLLDWNIWLENVRNRIKYTEFLTWFQRIELASFSPEALEIKVPNNFTRDWLKDHYSKEIVEAVHDLTASRPALTFIVDQKLEIQPSPSITTKLPPQEEKKELANLKTEPKTESLPKANYQFFANNSEIPLNQNYVFENFVVGPSNRFPHAAALAVVEQPAEVYNPFFIHGSVGLGKTHLLQAICHKMISEQKQTRILYLSCEAFVNHFIDAIEKNQLNNFRYKYRQVDVLVIDDVQFLANKERTQEEFFHTFNELYNQKKQIILSSDSSPAEIPDIQERLISRFKWGLVTEISPPTFETRMAIIRRKARLKGCEFPDDVINYLAEHVDTNIREIEGAILKIIGLANLHGSKIDLKLAEEACKDLKEEESEIRTNAKVAMEDILQVVTDHFHVKLQELQSKK